jgi:hypothetical protein
MTPTNRLTGTFSTLNFYSGIFFLLIPSSGKNTQRPPQCVSEIAHSELLVSGATVGSVRIVVSACSGAVRLLDNQDRIHSKLLGNRRQHAL